MTTNSIRRQAGDIIHRSKRDEISLKTHTLVLAISHREGDEAGVARKEVVGGPLYDLFGVQGIEFFDVSGYPHLGKWVLCGFPAVEGCGVETGIYCGVLCGMYALNASVEVAVGSFLAN